MADERSVPEDLAAWAEVLAYEFGLATEQIPLASILELAAEAAHGVTRPAAPVTAFVAGLVAGQQGATPEEVADAIAAARSLIADRDDDGTA